MFLLDELAGRAGRPVGTGLIGAGKFGTMFLSQVPTTAGIEVRAIADLDPDRAALACRDAGWSESQIAKTRYSDNALDIMRADGVDVVVEATGDAQAGLAHARAAIAAGKHVVMVNVEADVLAGPLIAREAEEAGVVCSMAYGDQPALVCELVEWARLSGFDVVAAGKGTKYLPSYHASTPETVWDHYGLSAREAEAAGMNGRMFNSFLDGTKSAIEMAAIANATGLQPPAGGLAFPPCGRDDLASTLRPASDGGILHEKGMVEVVSSLERDGNPVTGDLRWGVYVVIEAPSRYAADCFMQYGLVTDSTGRYAAMYRPFHLIGLELNASILMAALRGRPTGRARDFIADVVAVAKYNLEAGSLLDGEGGRTVWGKLLPAGTSIADDALPIGLAHNLRLRHPVAQNAVITRRDVESIGNSEAVRARLEMERHFAPSPPARAGSTGQIRS